MKSLDDIFSLMESMTDEELQAHVRHIRKDRGTSKKVQKTSTKKQRVATSDKIQDLLSAMSKEERMAFLQKISEGGK